MIGNEHPVNLDHASFKYRNHSDLSAVPEVLFHIQSFKSRLALCCWAQKSSEKKILRAKIMQYFTQV